VLLHYFVVSDDGARMRIPVSVMEKLQWGKAAIPAYAGMIVKAVEVQTSTDDNRVPQQVERVIRRFPGSARKPTRKSQGSCSRLLCQQLA